MNKKIIFAILIVFVFGIFFMSGGGNDVTVNDINFHIPEGFDDITQNTINTDATYESYTYENPETYDFFTITVYDNPNDEQILIDNLNNANYEKIDIKGKDVYYKLLLGSPDTRYHYVYSENGKYISMEIPAFCDAKALDSEELVNEIIK